MTASRAFFTALEKLPDGQGDQIGQIFSYCAILYCYFGYIFFKLQVQPKLWATFLHGTSNNFDKNGLG
jgi:hypothetical protein